MISHNVGAFEPERRSGGGAHHANLFDDRFVLAYRKNSKSITASLLAPGMLE
jgi:hypothetical protein